VTRWNLLGNGRTRWVALTFILLAAFVAVMGMILGFLVVRSVREQATGVPPRTPVAVTVPPTPSPSDVPAEAVDAEDATLSPTSPSEPRAPTATPQPPFEGPWTYGTSVEGRPLHAYRFGSGSSARAIIGGIHGGYEWNTVVLVSQTLEYLQENPTLVPDDVTLYVIPCANPDGYAAGTDPVVARMNGNGVDLNRNWDYNWQMTATHGTRPVYAGEKAFSEPETRALRDFILDHGIEAAIFYHSANARIFYGLETERSATYELALAVSEATGYPVAATMPGQVTTGDAVDWMSAQGLAGIEVELTTHEDIEWERNLRGLLAFLEWKPPTNPASASTVQTSQIGTSVQDRPIEVTQIGNGGRVALVVVGGIHGDEANTEALVRGLMERYAGAPQAVPDDFTLLFLPAMNPDGLAAGTRYNANNVDLNRNWPTDDWRADAARTSGVVPGSGGPAPGSEPEVQAVSRWLLETVLPGAQEVWLLSYHSAYPPDGGVQPGYTTYGTPGPGADRLARQVAEASGYTYLPTWPSEHRFTGELIHWCDVQGILSADVELPTHEAPDEATLATHERVLSALLGASAGYTGDVIEYVVQEGDTLSGIALEYGVEVDELMRLNQISDPDAIQAGETLLILVR